MKIKKLLSMLLTLSILSSTVAFADTQSSVKVNAESTSFSVEVPLTLPASVDGDGNVVVATDAKVINNSFGPVMVNAINVQPVDGWNLVDEISAKEKVGSKNFTMFLQDVQADTDGTVALTAEGWPSIPGGSKLSFSYDMKIAPQKNAIEDATIANVIFYVGWDAVDNGGGSGGNEDIGGGSESTPATEASLDWEYTTDDSTNAITLTNYIGESTDVVVKNKYAVNGTEYKNVELAESTIGRMPGGSTYNKSPFYNKQSSITSVVVEEGVKLPSDLSEYFYSFTSLETVDLEKADLTAVNNTSYMFAGDTSLTNVKMSSAPNLTNASRMFNGCSGLTADLTALNCTQLTNLDSMCNSENSTIYVSTFEEKAKLEASSERSSTCKIVVPGYKDITTINILSPMQTLEYSDGDYLDLTGLELEATYDDGTTGIISLDDENLIVKIVEIDQYSNYKKQINIDEPLVAGLNRVQIGHKAWKNGTYSKSFDISVVNRTLSAISLYSAPAKTAYSVSEKIDITGASVLATYSDGFTKEISTDKLSASPAAAWADVSNITLTFNGKSCTAPITVNSAETSNLEEASLNWEYTTSGNTIYLSKYIGESSDVVVHNAYLVDGIKYNQVSLTTTPGVGPVLSSSYKDEKMSAGPFFYRGVYGNNAEGTITSLVFEPGVKLPANSDYMFAGLFSGGIHKGESLVLDCSGLDTRNVESMYAIFASTDSTSIDCSTWGGEKVQDVRCMFLYNYYLESVDLSSFNFDKAIENSKTKYVFGECGKLTSSNIAMNFEKYIFSDSNKTTIEFR